MPIIDIQCVLRDKVYEVLDAEGARGAVEETARPSNERLKMDSDRKPRTVEDMESEARELEAAMRDA